MKISIIILAAFLVLVSTSCEEECSGDAVACFYLVENGKKINTYYSNSPISFGTCSVNYGQHRWDFGDGTTSKEPNPFHTFQEAGDYLVKLTIENECSTDMVEESITIEKQLQPLAFFTISPDRDTIPYYTLIKYTDQSENVFTGSWDFDGGEWVRGNRLMYETGGKKTIRRTVEALGLSDTYERKIFLSNENGIYLAGVFYKLDKVYVEEDLEKSNRIYRLFSENLTYDPGTGAYEGGTGNIVEVIVGLINTERGRVEGRYQYNATTGVSEREFTDHQIRVVSETIEGKLKLEIRTILHPPRAIGIFNE